MTIASESAGTTGIDTDNVRLALAISIVKARAAAAATGSRSVPAPHAPAPVDDGGAKRKVKQLKEEAVALRCEIDKLRWSVLESFVPPVLCRCFTDGAGEGNRGSIDGGSEGRVVFNDRSIARFLECVRVLNRRNKRRRIAEEAEHEDRAGQVAQIADFVVELISDGQNGQLLSVWLHEAVDFVQESVNWLLERKNTAAAVSTVKKLITRLIAQMIAFAPDKNPEDLKFDYRSCNQKVMMQLSDVPFIGQNLLIDTTRQLAFVAETLSHSDPFGKGVAQILENAYFLLELVEKLCMDAFSSWVKNDKLDMELLEEFVSSFFQMKTSMLGSGQLNLLFVVYTDRICAQIVKQLHTMSSKDEQLQRTTNNALQQMVNLASNASRLTSPFKSCK